MSKPDGDPAFAAVAIGPQGDTVGCWGMSLRDWFAGQALITLGQVNPNLPDDKAGFHDWPSPQELAMRRAVWSYLQADAMIAARDQT